jgi:hypothetical protein
VMVGSGTGSTTTMGSSVAIANLRVRNGNWIIIDEKSFQSGIWNFSMIQEEWNLMV